MNQDIVLPVDEFDAPYGRKVKFESIEYASGMRMLRLRIREGSRFTVLELDQASARRWIAAMASWADSLPPE